MNIVNIIHYTYKDPFSIKFYIMLFKFFFLIPGFFKASFTLNPSKVFSLYLLHRLWLLKCCKNKNSYGMKNYFHSVKTNLYSIKYIFIMSPFFYDVNIYFHSVKINLYSIRDILSYRFFFIQVNYIFIIWIFHWTLFWWPYLLFHLYLKKSQLYLKEFEFYLKSC